MECLTSTLMKRMAVSVFALVATASYSPSSYAVDVPFSGTLSDRCTMTMVRAGRFGVEAGGQILRSQATGGLGAIVDVITTSPGFTVTGVTPTSFETEPPADAGSPETFDADIRGIFATSFGYQDSHPLNTGRTRVRVRLTAQKPSGQTFAPGNYRAIVTVRCE